ncbi:MAG: sugar ABC transporter ATP-binding protein [Chloroflexota bacterium]|nr:sugar ABC transporter ATP-binding protein [Chloroflexota bacterium]
MLCHSWEARPRRDRTSQTARCSPSATHTSQVGPAGAWHPATAEPISHIEKGTDESSSGNQSSRPRRATLLTTSALLEVRGVAKAYGAVTALRNASLSVEEGEVVALVGDNGAGKSTLIKILSGVVTADAGEIRFDGRNVVLRRPGDATALGIQTVYQDLALCEHLDTIENIFLGREIQRPPRFGLRLARPQMEKIARAILASLGISIPRLDRPVSTLSGGQRQCVAVCRAVLGDPKLVILDEPTAALGVAQKRDVLELIRRLRDHGRGVVMISHNLVEVLKVADRIVVMRLGETVANRELSQWSERALVAAITGASSSTAREESAVVEGGASQ